ncbi:MAG: ATPase domain-containing protein [Candidatus Binataceae bacterium]
MAAALTTLQLADAASRRGLVEAPAKSANSIETLDFSGVFRGRELTLKDRRLNSGLPLIDRLIGGGIARGRISEILGNPGSGKTSLATTFMAIATARGEVAAWVDAAGGFDPESIAAAGVDLARVLWVAAPERGGPGRHGGDGDSRLQENFAAPRHLADDHLVDGHPGINSDESDGPPDFDDGWNYARGGSRSRRRLHQRAPWDAAVKTAELILSAGGFGLVVVDFGASARTLSQAVALRLARAAERGGTAVLILAAQRMCGTFAALSLVLNCRRACFSRAAANAPALFDGLEVEARVARNKLGGSGGAATWKALRERMRRDVA